MIRRGFRAKSYSPYTNGISHKELMSMTPIVDETPSERWQRLDSQEVGSCNGIHPKTLAVQETFARVVARRNKR